MVIDQMVSRNADGIRTVVDKQTGCCGDYLQLQGSALDCSFQVCIAIQLFSKAEWHGAQTASLWLENDKLIELSKLEKVLRARFCHRTMSK